MNNTMTGYFPSDRCMFQRNKKYIARIPSCVYTCLCHIADTLPVPRGQYNLVYSCNFGHALDLEEMMCALGMLSIQFLQVGPNTCLLHTGHTQQNQKSTCTLPPRRPGMKLHSGRYDQDCKCNLKHRGFQLATTYELGTGYIAGPDDKILQHTCIAPAKYWLESSLCFQVDTMYSLWRPQQRIFQAHIVYILRLRIGTCRFHFQARRPMRR